MSATKVFQRVKQTSELATFAGGCFWGLEKFFRQNYPHAFLDTAVGYTGGDVNGPSYEQVCTGKTGHAEAVILEYEKGTVSYEDMCRFFFSMHDPTTLNKQGNDVGSQYRSAIFYHTEDQKVAAEKIKKEITDMGFYKRPLSTEIVPAVTFFKAEDYHQRYLENNPNGYCNHFVRFSNKK